MPTTPEQQSSQTPIWLITLTVMLAAFMAVIDTSIVNVALPSISSGLGTTTVEMTSISTIYILANVIIMPLNGYMTALLGRKNYYALSLTLFTLSSLLCGLAWNLPSLVFFRLIQGLGGGALIPTAQAILFETYPRDQLGKAMGIFGMGVIVGPALGPVLGGWLVDDYGWRMIFLVNVPVGILTVLMTLRFIQNPAYHQKPEGKFDLLGLVLLIVCIGSMQYVLENGQDQNWFSSLEIVGLTLVAALGLIGFIGWELKTANPIVDLSIYRNRTFAAGNLLGVTTGFGLYGLNLILPLFLASILHYNALQSGLAILPGALATAVAMPIAGRLADRIDPRLSIGPGMLFFALSGWWLGTLTQQSGYWNFFYPRVLQGFSLGLIFVPLSTTSMSQVPRAQMSSASGLFSLVRQLGGSFGIAVLTTLLSYFARVKYAYLSEYIHASNPQAVERIQGLQKLFLSQGSDPAKAYLQAMTLISGNLRSQALILAYNHLFRLTALIFLASMVFLLFLRKKTVSGSSALA
jgi:MFS transporter, DHA2 family, multidrug resistance protein